MDEINRILVINPGSTSTGIAVYENRTEVWSREFIHSAAELQEFPAVIDQLEWRNRLVRKAIKHSGFKLSQLTAIVARGGAGLDPVPGGIYIIDKTMVTDLYQGKNAEHASNLGGIIALDLAEGVDIPAYTVNPVSVDEFEPVARLSGLPELPRRCQSHALNLKAVAGRVSRNLGVSLKKINLIGCHLGGGISIAPLKGGKIIDVNNANQGGPYSPERTGSLPVIELVKYVCQSNLSFNGLRKKMVGRGGLTAYLGTNDAQEVEKRIKGGDKKAKLVYKGMIYQISKEIGAMAAVLTGNIEAIFLTGGLAYSDYIVKGIKERVKFLAPVIVYPGAKEMKHLAAGASSALEGKEKVKKYANHRFEPEGLV